MKTRRESVNAEDRAIQWPLATASQFNAPLLLFAFATQGTLAGSTGRHAGRRLIDSLGPIELWLRALVELVGHSKRDGRSDICEEGHPNRVG